MPRILDGAALAAVIKQEVAEEVRALAERCIRPGLAAVLVGNVAASEIYVRNKVRICGEVGIYSDLITRPETVTTAELLELVASLNARDEIDGILIQLPLPAQVDVKSVLDSILPAKDVDGLHPLNAGLLQAGRTALAPCTPAGVIEILLRSQIPISGRHAVVVGRSDLVGKPAAMLLLHQNATVTICHSKTRDLGAITRQADILVAAIGRAGFITPEMVKPEATLIDVGINRIPGPDGKMTIVGDVAFDEVKEVAGALTPVPGGVGPMTIACLMLNTLTAAQARAREAARPAPQSAPAARVAC